MAATSEKLIDVTLPMELTNGNDGRGSKWFKSSTVRKKLEAQLRALGHERDPFDFPVRVRMTRILKKNQRLWDADSILRGNSKELIDAMVSVGWFHDDSPKFVTEVVGRQDASQRENGPAIRVEVTR